MLNKFSSATRNLQRVIAQINPNNLVSSDLTGSLLNIKIPSQTKFQSKSRHNVISTIVNDSTLNTQSFLTSSLLNIELPSSQSFQSHIRSNPNPIKLVNNTNNINEFHNQIFEYSARYTKRVINEFDSILNTLTIKNVLLDYGTEDVTPENFEILLFGLHIPGDFIVNQIGTNVVITLNDEYIDFDNTTTTDIYVYGKFVDIILDTENSIDLATEDGEILIIQ
jgi:hypothetical protein